MMGMAKVATPLASSSIRAQELTNAITKTMIWDLEPYSLVDHRGFCALMRTLEPQYVIPSRTTFSRELIPSIYENEKRRIKQIIQEDIAEGNF